MATVLQGALRGPTQAEYQSQNTANFAGSMQGLAGSMKGYADMVDARQRRAAEIYAARVKESEFGPAGLLFNKATQDSIVGLVGNMLNTRDPKKIKDFIYGQSMQLMGTEKFKEMTAAAVQQGYISPKEAEDIASWMQAVDIKMKANTPAPGPGQTPAPASTPTPAPGGPEPVRPDYLQAVKEIAQATIAKAQSKGPIVDEYGNAAPYQTKSSPQPQKPKDFAVDELGNPILYPDAQPKQAPKPAITEGNAKYVEDDLIARLGSSDPMIRADAERLVQSQIKTWPAQKAAGFGQTTVTAKEEAVAAGALPAGNVGVAAGASQAAPAAPAQPVGQAGTQTFRQWLIAHPEISSGMSFSRDPNQPDSLDLRKGAPKAFEQYQAELTNRPQTPATAPAAGDSAAKLSTTYEPATPEEQAKYDALDEDGKLYVQMKAGAKLQPSEIGRARKWEAKKNEEFTKLTRAKWAATPEAKAAADDRISQMVNRLNATQEGPDPKQNLIVSGLYVDSTALAKRKAEAAIEKDFADASQAWAQGKYLDMQTKYYGTKLAVEFAKATSQQLATESEGYRLAVDAATKAIQPFRTAEEEALKKLAADPGNKKLQENLSTLRMEMSKVPEYVEMQKLLAKAMAAGFGGNPQINLEEYVKKGFLGLSVLYGTITNIGTGAEVDTGRAANLGLGASSNEIEDFDAYYGL